MKNKAIYSLFIGFCMFNLLLISPAGATPSQELDTCLINNNSNVGWAYCTSHEVAEQEKILQTVWKCVRDQYIEQIKTEGYKTNAGYKALLKDQRTWEAHKKNACQFFNLDFGREGQVLHYGLCQAHLIQNRIDYLNGIIGMETCKQ